MYSFHRLIAHIHYVPKSKGFHRFLSLLYEILPPPLVANCSRCLFVWEHCGLYSFHRLIAQIHSTPKPRGFRCFLSLRYVHIHPPPLVANCCLCQFVLGYSVLYGFHLLIVQSNSPPKPKEFHCSLSLRYDNFPPPLVANCWLCLFVLGYSGLYWFHHLIAHIHFSPKPKECHRFLSLQYETLPLPLVANIGQASSFQTLGK